MQLITKQVFNSLEMDKIRKEAYDEGYQHAELHSLPVLAESFEDGVQAEQERIIKLIKSLEVNSAGSLGTLEWTQNIIKKIEEEEYERS